MNPSQCSALALIKKGFRVFPVAANEKRPAAGMANWPDRASATPKVVMEMFPQGNENIGVFTGDRDFFVVDLDVSDNVNGIENFRQLAENHGQKTVETLTAATPSGGQHLFYRSKVNARNSTEKLAPGVDVRGFNGYVVGVGSKNPHGLYTWKSDRPIADAPNWLEALVSRQETERQERKTRPHALTVNDLRELLTFINDNDTRDNWMAVIWALRRSEKEPGEYLEIADEWSASSEKYFGVEDVRRKYEEADDREGYGIGTLWKMALAGGWKPTAEQHARLNPIDAAKEFEIIPEDSTYQLKHQGKIQLLRLPPDLLSQDFPERQFAVNPLFPLKCVTLLVGEGSTGKSYLQLAAMLHIAGGINFLGLPVRAGIVIYFSAEDDHDEVKRRAQRIISQMPADARALSIENFRLIDAVGKDLQFVTSREGITRISNMVDEIVKEVAKSEKEKIQLITVDTLSRVNGGDENSNTVMSAVIKACERIAQCTGAAVCILHHTGKANARTRTTDAYSARGASALSDNARSVLLVCTPLTTSAEAMGKSSDDFESDAMRGVEVRRRVRRQSEQQPRRAWPSRSTAARLPAVRPSWPSEIPQTNGTGRHRARCRWRGRS